MRNYFSVEEDFGGKYIHYLGYLDEDSAYPAGYRSIEGTFCIAYIEDIPRNTNPEKHMYELFDTNKQYVYELDKNDYNEMLQEYYDGQPGRHLQLKDVNQNTPCGDYWF